MGTPLKFSVIGMDENLVDFQWNIKISRGTNMINGEERWLPIFFFPWLYQDFLVLSWYSAKFRRNIDLFLTMTIDYDLDVVSKSKLQILSSALPWTPHCWSFNHGLYRFLGFLERETKNSDLRWM